jgi:hypothetical protein
MATLTNRTIKSTYGQLIQLEDLQFQNGFGTSSLSGSYELIGDQNITGSLYMSGNLYLAGTASVDYLVSSYESSSIIFSSGSTKFGDTLDDTHEFTGSILSTGSFYGMAVSGNFTGSGEGLYDILSASFAETASYASSSVSAASSSVAGKSFNSELVQEDSSGATHYLVFSPNTSGESGLLADAAINYIPSTETLAVTKVIGNLEGSASFALTASFLQGLVESASFAVTASLAISTSIVNITTQSFAQSGDGPFTGSFSSSFYSFLSGSMTGSYTGSLTGSLIGTASIADFATTASFALNVPTTASYALAADTASHALTIKTGLTSSFADNATSASISDTSSFSITGDGLFSGSFSGSFQGDGSNLSGLNEYTVANSSNNRVITSVDSNTGNAEANLTFDGNTLTIVGNINTGIGATEVHLMNQNLRSTDAVTFTTVDTGQGANELYAMNQNVRTTDSPTFDALTVSTINTGQGVTEVYLMNQNVRSTDAVTFTTVDTGQGANELYAMNQNVRTTDSPSFSGLTLSGNLTASTVNTGQGNNELYAMNQNVRTTDSVTFANINTGQGITEVHLMDQNIRTTDGVTFATITETSARKYKENIIDLESGDLIHKLRPVTFNWKTTGEKDYGLIAEEVNEHLPELVKKDLLGEVEGIKYSKLTSLLIKVVQDQQQQIDRLTKDVNWLKSHI